MAGPQLVIFDCDGVLVDSERTSHEVLIAMLAEHGKSISFDEAVATFMGSSIQRALQLVETMTGVPPEVFEPRFRDRSFEAFQRSLQPVPGVPELLATLGLPFCVASNGPHEKMALTLGKTGLLPLFEGRRFSADDVQHPKPAPDLFLLAAERLGVPPAHCVVVEDSPTGVQAARAAGMAVLGFAAMTPAQRLLEAGAHKVFDRMSHLPELLATLHGDPWLQRWLPLLQQRAGRVLEIGCGPGDDTATLADAGLQVHAFDLSAQAVAATRARVPGATVEQRDLAEPGPLAPQPLDAIVASLTLHYFPWPQTRALVQRLHQALRPGGLLLCRLNSTQDHHHGAHGHPEIEPGLFSVDGQPKRFFDEAAVEALFREGWQRVSREHRMTFKYPRPKALWELVLERGPD